MARQRRLAQRLGFAALAQRGMRAVHVGPHSVEQLHAAAIVHGHDQRHPVVVLRLLPRLREGVARLLGQLVGAPDGHHAHVLFVQAVHLGQHRGGEQVHEADDLVLRALPVLGRERVDGQIAHAHVGRAADGFAHRLDTGLMAEQAVLPPLFRPAAVAVHDDGHMLRHRRSIELRRIEIRRGVGEYVVKRLIQGYLTKDEKPTASWPPASEI